ncbi:13680_t:CDS:2 [Gigaspora margarita]|uniref:13680_t:CDS:1 n=1 Tax=Gigaspora margarita TaxID=4874 RepID=A0ABN7URA2_GIGMA|nr:13680_t:CDS:2 [Gigaspora margarita]
MTQLYPLAIVNNNRIYALRQNVSSTSPNPFAEFRIQNLKGPIDEVTLNDAILTPCDAREHFSFRVSDYDGMSATVRISYNYINHEDLVKRLSSYSGINKLSTNGFSDWIPLDSCTVNILHPHSSHSEKISSGTDDLPLEIEKVDRAIDNMAGAKCGIRTNTNTCLVSLFPGSIVTSSNDGNFHIIWSNSIKNISAAIQLFNFVIIGRTNRFFEKTKDRFLLLSVHILNAIRSIPVLHKTIMIIKRFFESHLIDEELKDLFKNIDDLLIKLGQTIESIINTLEENRYDQLNEDANALQERTNILTYVMRGAILGAVFFGGMTFSAGVRGITRHQFIRRLAGGIVGCVACGSVYGFSYLLSSQYKEDIDKYKKAKENFKKMDELFSNMNETNVHYLHLDDQLYPGKAEIFADVFKKFQTEVQNMDLNVI